MRSIEARRAQHHRGVQEGAPAQMAVRVGQGRAQQQRRAVDGAAGQHDVRVPLTERRVDGPGRAGQADRLADEALHAPAVMQQAFTRVCT
jgi:hypothetical protein